MKLTYEDIASKFFYFGLTSFAKSVIFRSSAFRVFDSGEKIISSITVYYSLFHLSIAAMYFCPQMLSIKKCEELLDKLENDPDEDPTPLLSHNYAIGFANKCVSNGLPKDLPELLGHAKDIREFVNYGPRLQLRPSASSLFLSSKFQVEQAIELVDKLDEVIITTFDFIHTNCFFGLGKVAIEEVNQFLVEPKLLYVQWCSEEIH